MYATPFAGRGVHSRASRAVLVVAAACALASCGEDRGRPSDAADAPEVAAAPAASAGQDDLAATDTTRLGELAVAAVNDMRLLAPAGDNAVEYYLALRERSPGDPAVANALTDLQPYALIATEQSIAREDFVEAARLLALMTRVDPKAPALARLKQAIATQQQQVAQRAAEQARVQADDARRLAEAEAERIRVQQLAEAADRQAAQREAERRAAEQREAERRAAEQQAAEQRVAQEREQAAAAARAKAASLRAISTPAPRYPARAQQDGVEGRVLVEFTVQPNGSVGAVRVVSAAPEKIFDDAALAAVKRWRFEPVAAPVTAQRSIRFSPTQ